MDDRKILNDFPLPIARGYRRYLNATEPRERHDGAYFLFEFYLKFAASVAIATYLAGDDRDHRVNAALKGLARPSLGEWLRFLRECIGFLANRPDPDPTAKALAALFETRESRWKEAVALHNELQTFRTKSAGGKEKVSLEGLLNEIVAYRNLFLGHGAPLDAEHYRRFADLLAAGFGALLEQSPFLVARRLVAFDSIQVHEGSSVECSVIEFMGDSPIRRKAPLVIPYGKEVPRKTALYLLDEEGRFLSLDPLLIAQRDDVYVLNEAQGAPEYLSYATGERYRPSSLSDAEGELFGRILGYRVDSSQLSRIGEDVAVEAKPAAEGEERKLGDYRILREVGRGAMGVVFEAYQESLGRRVALKVLPGNFALDPKRVERFRREARATARIHHPAIVPVYEVGESEGTHFYSMEFIDGPSLADSLEAARREAKEGKVGKGSSAAGAASLERTVEQIALVAEGLEVAHRQGLVHRDVKPSNILIDGGGRHVLVDFGLVRDEEAQTLTRSGEMVGTLGYMSPEQVSRRPVDRRSDVYSLGATLYEVLTLRTPFGVERESEHAIHSAILFKEPPSPRNLHPRLPGDLETIVLRALEKDPERRYSSAGELAADLRRHLRGESIHAKPPSTWTRISRKALRNKLRVGLAATTLVAFAALAVIAWNYSEGRAERAAREKLLPEIERLVQKEDFLAAYRLAREAERSIPGDPVLAALWPRLTLPATITSNPSGAEVSFKKYEDVLGEWIRLGMTPLEDVQIPRGVFRWMVAKPDFVTLECGPRRLEEYFQAGATRFGKTINFELFEEKGRPPGMVWIPPDALRVELGALSAPVETVKAPGYWIDKFEVTNAEFQEFVDRGGYGTKEFWKEEFIKDGKVISWDRAREEFRDRTGQPGPSTWEGGKHSPGKEKHPVAGVSWFEAAAYAEFRGKSLPTIFHWANAACTSESSIITRLSNFSGEGTAPVGSHAGIGFTGLSDMAGNVKEWCWNAGDPERKRRYIPRGGVGRTRLPVRKRRCRVPLGPLGDQWLPLRLVPCGEGIPSRSALPVDRAGLPEELQGAPAGLRR